MIHFTGPSAHAALTGSLAFGGILNSWNATNMAGRESASPVSAGRPVFFFAASKAAIAFFEYIEGSIVARGCSERNDSKSTWAFSAWPRLASHTPR